MHRVRLAVVRQLTKPEAGSAPFHRTVPAHNLCREQARQAHGRSEHYPALPVSMLNYFDRIRVSRRAPEFAILREAATSNWSWATGGGCGSRRLRTRGAGAVPTSSAPSPSPVATAPSRKTSDCAPAPHQFDQFAPTTQSSRRETREQREVGSHINPHVCTGGPGCAILDIVWNASSPCSTASRMPIGQM